MPTNKKAKMVWHTFRNLSLYFLLSIGLPGFSHNLHEHIASLPFADNFLSNDSLRRTTQNILIAETFRGKPDMADDIVIQDCRRKMELFFKWALLMPDKVAGTVAEKIEITTTVGTLTTRVVNALKSVDIKTLSPDENAMRERILSGGADYVLRLLIEMPPHYDLIPVFHRKTVYLSIENIRKTIIQQSKPADRLAIFDAYLTSENNPINRQWIDATFPPREDIYPLAMLKAIKERFAKQ